HLDWEYSEQIHSRQTIRHLAQQFLAALQEIIAHCQSHEAGGYTPVDFPLISLNQPLLDSLCQRSQLRGHGRPGANIEDIYSLSPMQHGLLFHSLYAPEVNVYSGQFGWLLRGAFHIHAWLRAWSHVIQRHTILRTLFLWHGQEQPLQIVCRRVALPWRLYDWQGLPEREQQAQMHRLYQDDRLLGFDLQTAPLLRLTLIRLGGSVHYFLFTLHHLLLDGWSMPLLFQEVERSYRAYSQDRQPVLSSPRPYREYIGWLRQQNTEHAQQFWCAYLAGFTTPTILAVDRAVSDRRSAGSQRMALEKRRLSTETTEALERLVHRGKVTLNTIIQGAWALLLAHYSAERDILF